MQNAIAPVKAIADDITRNNAQDGVANYYANILKWTNQKAIRLNC